MKHRSIEKNSVTQRSWQILVLLTAMLLAQTAEAKDQFTNATLLIKHHPKPVLHTNSDAYAHTIQLEDKHVLVVNRNTVNGIPLWKFELADAYWWVSTKGVIWGEGTHDKLDPARQLEAKDDHEAYRIFLAMK